MLPFVPLVLTWILAAGVDHTELNPVFTSLVEQGVVVSDEQRVPLPAPVLPDGLDRQAQQEIVRKASGRHDYARFTRNSTVAPEAYEYRTIEEQDDQLVYGIDVYFIVHARLETIAALAPEEFFDVTASAEDVTITVLDEAALQEHGVEPVKGAQVEERFEHVSYPLFNKVQLEVTNQAQLSTTGESLVRATRLDERFTGSHRFPNQWRPMRITSTGETELGDPHPFRGTGMYIKITELHEPAGALFVEYHSVSVEPKGWFDGAPLIRSKLRLLLQREVRKFRHTLKEREGA